MLLRGRCLRLRSDGGSNGRGAERFEYAPARHRPSRSRIVQAGSCRPFIAALLFSVFGAMRLATYVGSRIRSFEKYRR